MKHLVLLTLATASAQAAGFGACCTHIDSGGESERLSRTGPDADIVARMNGCS